MGTAFDCAGVEKAYEALQVLRSSSMEDCLDGDVVFEIPLNLTAEVASAGARSGFWQPKQGDVHERTGIRRLSCGSSSNALRLF